MRDKRKKMTKQPEIDRGNACWEANIYTQVLVVFIESPPCPNKLFRKTNGESYLKLGSNGRTASDT